MKYGKRLKNLNQIRTELARVYNEYERGRIETPTYRAMCFGLTSTANVAHMHVMEIEMKEEVEAIRDLIISGGNPQIEKVVS